MEVWKVDNFIFYYENLHSQMKFKASLLVSEVSYIGLMVLLGVDGIFNVFSGRVIPSMIEIKKTNKQKKPQTKLTESSHDGKISLNKIQTNL